MLLYSMLSFQEMEYYLALAILELSSAVENTSALIVAIDICFLWVVYL